MSKIFCGAMSLIFFFAVSEYLNSQQLFALNKSKLVNIHSEIKIGEVEINKIKSQKNSLSIEIEKLNQQLEKEKGILKDLQNKQDLLAKSNNKINSEEVELKKESAITIPKSEDQRIKSEYVSALDVNSKQLPQEKNIFNPEESISYGNKIVKDYNQEKESVSYNDKNKVVYGEEK